MDALNAPFPSFTKTWHVAPYPAISPSRPELQGNGKFVIITGGGSSIGLAIAKAYAQAGATTIAILGRRIDVLKKAADEIRAAVSETATTVLYETADISIRESIESAIERLLQQAGDGVKVDVLVSNAGILPGPGPIMGFPADELRMGLEINVTGPFNLIQAVLPRAVPNLHILNISSGIGHMQAIPGGTWAYAATKLAVVKMFDYLSLENPQLHVVSIQPGVVASDMNTKHGGLPPMDEADLAGHFAVWLASDEARFLNNRFVWVNWDVEELKARATEIESSSLLKVKIEGIDT